MVYPEKQKDPHAVNWRVGLLEMDPAYLTMP